MLKKETIQKIASMLKLDEKTFSEAIAATEEKEVAIAELTVLTADELTARDTVKINEGKKTGESEGEKKGKELATKAIKKKLGIETETKDPDKAAEEIQAKLQTGDTGLKEQITLLQKTVSEKDIAIAAKEKEAKQAVFDAGLLTKFPATRKAVADGGFSDAEYLAAIKANLEFEHTDTGIVVKKGGQILRHDKTQNPLSIDDVVPSYFGERKWTKEDAGAQGGRGGKDANGKTVYAKQSEVLKDWEAQGKSAATADYQMHLQSIVKENPSLDLNG